MLISASPVKFARPYDGPWKISKLIPPSTYVISCPDGKVTGVVNKQTLKLHLSAE
jgi:hypothetical protein